MAMQDGGQHRGIDMAAAERRLERTVAAALRVIDAAHAERQAPPVRAARHRLGRSTASRGSPGSGSGPKGSRLSPEAGIRPATRVGLEPTTCRLEGGCSIQLSYGAWCRLSRKARDRLRSRRAIRAGVPIRTARPTAVPCPAAGVSRNGPMTVGRRHNPFGVMTGWWTLAARVLALLLALSVALPEGGSPRTCITIWDPGPPRWPWPPRWRAWRRRPDPGIAAHIHCGCHIAAPVSAPDPVPRWCVRASGSTGSPPSPHLHRPGPPAPAPARLRRSGPAPRARPPPHASFADIARYAPGAGPSRFPCAIL